MIATPDIINAVFFESNDNLCTVLQNACAVGGSSLMYYAIPQAKRVISSSV